MTYRFNTRHLNTQQNAIINQRDKEKELREKELKEKETIIEKEE